MTINEHLLIKIAEECNEVAQRCQKALCYGENQIQEGQSLTNIQRIEYEWNDLLAIIEIANDRGIIILPDENQIALKQNKYLVELNKSISLGTVERDKLTDDQKRKLLEGDWCYQDKSESYDDEAIKKFVLANNFIPPKEFFRKDGNIEWLTHSENKDLSLISKTDKDRIIVLKGMLKELPATLTDENMDKMSEIGEEIRKIGRKYEML